MLKSVHTTYCFYLFVISCSLSCSHDASNLNDDSTIVTSNNSFIDTLPWNEAIDFLMSDISQNYDNDNIRVICEKTSLDSAYITDFISYAKLAAHRNHEGDLFLDTSFVISQFPNNFFEDYNVLDKNRIVINFYLMSPIISTQNKFFILAGEVRPFSRVFSALFVLESNGNWKPWVFEQFDTYDKLYR